MNDTTYWVDDSSLDDPAGRWFLSTGSPLSPIAAPILSALRPPGREGVVYAGWTPYAETELPLRIGITDNTSAGEQGAYLDLVANLRAVAGILFRNSDLTITRLQGGITTSVTGRVSTASDPLQLDERNAALTVLVTLAPPFWAEVATRDWPGVNVAPSATATISPLSGSTAPILNGAITVAGPCTTFEVRDKQTDRWLKVSTPVASGKTLTIDLAGPSAKVGTADVTGAIDVGPHGFALTPNAAGDVVVELTRSGGNGLVSATNLRKAWL